MVQRLDAPVERLVAVGTLGSILMALSSWWAGAIPIGYLEHEPAVLSVLAPNSTIAVAAFWIGLVLAIGAWLLIGHQVIEGAWIPVKRLRRAAVLWTAPFVVAMPAASRDVWAYAAQGHIAATGANPYTTSPLAVPGLFTDNVSPRWQGVNSPYGPLWTWLDRGVSSVFGSHVVFTVLGLRVLSMAGLVMLLATLPHLARRFGGRPQLALWLVLLNPLTVLHLVAGAHNDLLMIGLLAVALYVATAVPARWAALLGAGALAGLAAAVKFPAIIAVPFLPLLWAQSFALSRPVRHWPEFHRRLPELAGGVGLAGVGAVASTAVTTGLAGYGLTWTRNLSSGGHGGGVVAGVAMLAVIGVSWFLALRWPPAAMLTVALAGVVLITPAALPWYWMWIGVVVGCVVARRAAVLGLATWSLALMFQVNPSGITTHLRMDLSVAIALLLTWAVVDRTWRPFEVLPPAGSAPAPAAADAPAPG